MLFRGDYVTHITFPPVEGVVAIVQPNGDSYKVAVLKQDGLLYWDDIKTWSVVTPYDVVSPADDFGDSNEVIIDGDFKEI